MNSNVSQSLEKLLFEQETVILPGFGGFTTTRTSASVDYAQGSLTPPSRAISFNENLTVNDGLLVQRVSRDFGIPTDQALEEVVDFVEKTRFSLDQREIITLPGVGRLYKNYAQKVQFLPDNANFNTDSFGLPPLQFSPIVRSREVKEQAAQVAVAAETASLGSDTMAVPNQSGGPSSGSTSGIEINYTPPAPPAQTPPSAPPDARQSQPSRPFYLNSLLPWIVGLLALALAVGFWFFQQKQAKINPNPIVLNEKTEVVEPGLGGLGPNLPADKPAEKPAVKNEDDTPDSPKNDDDADEVSEARSKKSAAETGKNPTAAPDNSAAENSGEGRRAVIVVGTYKDRKNADAMLALLKKNGWDTYFRNEKGWQVGIETRYKDLAELKTHLKNLESQTNEDNIWIKKK